MPGEMVFLSHPSELSEWPTPRSYVQKAKDAVATANMRFVEMQHFGASSRSPLDICMEELRRTEIYLGVIGFRYGSQVPGLEVSYTELEFDTAGDLQMDRLLFLLREPPDDPSLVDADRTRIDRFRNKILNSGVVVAFVDTADNLEFHAYYALIKERDARARAQSDSDSAGPGWVMAGQGSPGETRAHFHGRGRGQRSRSGTGDLFRGRTAALAVVTGWLNAELPEGRVLVVTGQPGAGKSALVARAVLDLEQADQEAGDTATIGLAFHAREATLAHLLTAMARLTGQPVADSIAGMIDRLPQSAPPMLRIVVDALDEAASEADRDKLVEALIELAAQPQARVVVATRPMTSNRFGPGSIFYRMGVRSATARNLVDLDEDRYFERAGLRDFAAALLRQDGAAVPVPASGAWQAYRDDLELCHRLAEAIAERAGKNHLVAALTADLLSQADEPLDPEGPRFDPADLPSTVNEALDKYLARQPAAERERVRTLLLALAYARGAGIDDALWLDFAQRLGYQADVPALNALRRSAAADYLLETSRSRDAPVTRLFHQALTDDLIDKQRRPSQEGSLLDGLLPAPPSTWNESTSYARSFAADHANAADRLTELLTDPAYATVADLDRLLAVLPAEPVPAVAGVVDVLRTAASRAHSLQPDRRARLFALTAAHLGHPDLTARFGYPGAPTNRGGITVTPRWAHTIGTPHQELIGHSGPVHALAFGRAAERDVIISGGDDRGVRLWEPDTGQSPDVPLVGHTGAVRAVAWGRNGEQDIVVSGGADGVLRRWDPVAGQGEGEPMTGHSGAVLAIAFGRGMLASAGAEGSIRLWDPGTGRSRGEPLLGHNGEVRAVAIGRATQRDMLASGGYDGTVRLWDPHTGQSRGAPLTGHAGAVWAVAVGRAGERDAVVSAGADGTIRLWDPDTGRPVGAPLTGHTGAVRALALGRVGSRSVIVSGGEDGSVRVWDPDTGKALGVALVGHAGYVRTVSFGLLAGRGVIASGGDDGTVRLWDLYAGQLVGAPLPGHASPVLAVALGRVVHNISNTRDVAVSGGQNHTVRLWDAHTGRTLGQVASHTGPVLAVALGRLAEREVVASGGEDRMVRLTDPRTGQSLAPLDGHNHWVHALAVSRVGRTDLVISGGADATVRVWEPHRRKPLLATLTGHTAAVLALAAGRVNKTDVIASADADGVVRLWDADRKRPMSPVLSGHVGAVPAVAIGRLNDRAVVVSGGADGTVRVWDAQTGRPLVEPFVGHNGSVTALAVGRVGDRDVIVSGGEDCTVRVWDPSDATTTVIQDCYFPVRAVAMTETMVVFASGMALCAVSLL